MSRVKEETIKYIENFAKKYHYAMFCEIGYRQVRNGKWTWEISGMLGNWYMNNKSLKHFPLFDDDIEASEAVILLCKKLPQFKNKEHMEIYDFLPLEV